MYFSYLQGSRGVSPRYSYEEPRKNTWLLIVAIVCSVIVATGFLAQRVFERVSAIPLVASASQASLPSSPTIVPATVIPEENKLQIEIDAWVSGQKGTEWSVFTQSLSDDSLSAAVNSNKQYELASIYKLFLLQPLAEKVQSLSWQTTKLNSKTYADCVTLMIKISDNPCAEAISTKLSFKYVDSVSKKQGYANTQLNRRDYFAGTTADTGLLLSKLYIGESFDSIVREQTMSAMSVRKSTEAIRRVCDNCQVYNKTGDINGMKHDAALVTKNGKTYVIVIFSKASTWSKVTELAQVITNHL